MPEDVAKVIFAIGVLIFAVMRVPFELRARKIGSRKRIRATHERLLIVSASIGLYLVPIIFVFFDAPRIADRTSFALVGWLGALLFLAGQAVLVVAHGALGRNFSGVLVIREKHQLVSNGIYGLVRHPIYSGFWLWAVGQALLLPNWVAGLAGIVGFGILYFSRVAEEERLMLESFGDDYRAYMRRTPRLIPSLAGILRR